MVPVRADEHTVGTAGYFLLDFPWFERPHSANWVSCGAIPAKNVPVTVDRDAGLVLHRARTGD